MPYRNRQTTQEHLTSDVLKKHYVTIEHFDCAVKICWRIRTTLSKFSPAYLLPLPIHANSFLYLFFGRLESTNIGQSYAYVALLWILKDIWIKKLVHDYGGDMPFYCAFRWRYAFLLSMSPEMEFLDINLTKYLSLLLHAINSHFYWCVFY